MYLVIFREKRKRMAQPTRLRTAGDTRSSNSLVRSKAQGKVQLILMANEGKDLSVKEFGYYPPLPTGWDSGLLHPQVYFRQI